jgi:hypothetical protein
MRVLLLSGLGPYALNMKTMDGTLLGPDGARGLHHAYVSLIGRPLDPAAFRIAGSSQPLLRPARGAMPHLTTETVRSILEASAVDYELLELADLWNEARPVPAGPFDVVGLSTTFICDVLTLRRTIKLIRRHWPEATLVLGGQFSNLKFESLLTDYSAIDYVVRGDAELALPRLLQALQRGESLATVPNLASRDAAGGVVTTPVQYIDIEAHPSPAFNGHHAVIPYESMRGCPFTCKFCSFPFASPQWRFKSAEKICGDWARYARDNSASRIWARDSTFTIPPPRFRALLERLPDVGVEWDAYTRANVIDSADVVSRLEASRCVSLFIGYEAMSDAVLKHMDKKVNAAQNRRAQQYLAGTSIDVHGSFMVGYPGETVDDFQVTAQFLIEEYRGRFGLHFFTMQDETMPVWQDAERHQLEVTNAISWKHAGMDSETALALRATTLTKVRWGSEAALMQLWQTDYQRPFLPDASVTVNQRVEKLLERLAFVPKDLGTGAQAAETCRALLDELTSLGVIEGSSAGPDPRRLELVE